MPYEKDIYGNVIGTGGDDTRLQNEKMAGYPGYNLFDKQREAAVLTQDEIQQRSGVNVGVPNVPKGAVSVVPSGVPVGNPQIVRQPATVSGGNANFVGNKAPKYGPITSTEQLAAAMGYTSPEEEERLRKASVTNQRILAIGDALRHIGNIANTVRYAPSQQFSSPVTDEMARYERGKALRDAANSRYLVYQQQKERQDALQRRWENELEYKRQKEEAAAKARADKAKDARDRWQATLAYNKERDDKNREFKKEQDKWRREQGQQRIDISASRASNSGSRRSGSGGRSGKSASDLGFWDKDGNYHQYKTVTGLAAGLREYAPELPTTETYDRTDATGKKVKGTMKKSVGRLAGEANARYNPKHKGKATTQGKTPSKGKATAKGKVSNKSGFFN